MFGMVATGILRGTRAVTSHRWAFAGLFIVLGLFTILVLGLPIASNVTSIYRFSGGGDPVKLPEIPLPSQLTVILLGLIIAATGIYHGVRGFKNPTQVLALNMALLVAAFLTWSIRGAGINLTGLFQSTLLRAVPFLLGALSGIMCERSGIINIAVEGMMLMAAFVSVVATNLAGGNVWIGLMAGLAVGALLAGIHAVLSIHFKVDQIISGTGINIFAAGMTNYLDLTLLEKNQALNDSHTFGPLPIPVLSQIPIVGPILFNANVIVYGALILMFVVQFLLYSTRWGLRTRAVGEHPKAADTLGVNVFRIRYTNVIFAGMLAALGGCFLTLASVGRFNKLMTNGRGFIALAAMIFGNWTPFGALGASLIFGFADSLQIKLQILSSAIPSEFLLMAPYLATMIVLAGVVGRVRPPAAEGIPYEKQ